MNIARTVVAACATATIVLLAPAVALAARATISYLPNPPPCTTKDAQRPNPAYQRPANPWAQPAAQNLMLLSRHEEPNDFPMLSTFPTGFVQPSDYAVTHKSSQPATFANGQKALPISTCSNDV